MADSTLIDLERHRVLLETQVSQLRKALQTWQLWSAEYEGLKEEIMMKPSPTSDDLFAIARDFNGTNVTMVELDDILNLEDTPRSARQVVELLAKRVDVVSQNVSTAESQLRAAEEKLEKVKMVEDDLEDAGRGEEGLPLTEITEQLDDDDNVISYKTTTPGMQKGQLLDVLRKAGVSEEEMAKMAGRTVGENQQEIEKEAEEETPQPAPKLETKKVEKVEGKKVETEIETLPGITIKKKGVNFTEDTKPGPDAVPSPTEKRVESIMELAKAQNEPITSPIIPEGESEEDARMRSEMLAYGMSEIGTVVAELELENGSDWDEDDYTDDEIEATDDEDEFGRSRSKWVDGDVHKRMRELEEKLDVRGLINVGSKPPAEISTEKSNPEAGIGQIKITQEDIDASAKLARKLAKEEEERELAIPVQLIPEMPSTTSTPTPASTLSSGAKKEKKGVRFNPYLDISPPPEGPKVEQPVRPKARVVAPITDIVERAPRSTTSTASAAPTAPTPKASKFKAARGAGPLPAFIPPTFVPARDSRTVPTGPENATLATQIFERDLIPSASVAEPDELDPGLLQQEVATEYHKRRNEMIMKEGGFKAKSKTETVSGHERFGPDGEILDDQEYEADGKPVKKMSRFMAARLGKTA